MLILRSASARDDTTRWGQPLSQHWLGTVLCWAHSGDTAYRGHYIYTRSTDHCPPLPDICTSTHRACSGCSVLAVSGASSCGRISLLLAVRTSFISTRSTGTFLRQSTCCRSRDVPEFQGLVIINKHLLIGTKPTTFYSFITPALHSHSYPHTWTLFLHWTLVELHLS